MDTVHVLWQRIEAWLSTHTPHAWQKLAPGAHEEEIRQAEATLGIMLPADFKASCRIHNGGYAVDLFTPMNMFPLTNSVGTWQMLKELLDLDTWSDLTPYYFTESVIRSGWQTGPLQPTWWSAHWIPFGGDRAGNYCCLDLAPTEGGVTGRVIDWDHEVGPSHVLFPSFQQLLSTFADQMEAGDYLDTPSGLALRPDVEEDR